MSIKNIYLDMHIFRTAYASLLIEHPELADDDDLKADVLEGQTNFNEMMSYLNNVDLDAEGMADAQGARMDELSERKKRFRRKSDAARKAMQILLNVSNQQKCELPEATISLRNDPPRPFVADENLLPDGAFKIKREVSMTQIKELLKDNPVPGVAMTNGGQSISIRRK